jgi:hypothetical protein
MPYINKTHYFEYDFKACALVDLREIMKKIYRQTNLIGLFDGVEPPVSALREKYYEADREFKPTRKHKRLTGNFPSYYYMDMFKQKANLQKELKAFLVSTFKAWGLHLMEKYKDNPAMLGRTGFPYACLDNLPMPYVGFLQGYHKGKNVNIFLICRNDAAQLLKTFNWEASPDGGATWFSVGKSNMPEKRVTAALEYGREYLFRVYASNPRYKSPYSNSIPVRNYCRPPEPDKPEA